MKKIFFIALFCVNLSSCNERFINLEPVASGSSGQFYKSANDVLNAINATYAVLQATGVNGNDFVYGDLPTDDTFASNGTCIGGFCDFDIYQVLPVGSSAAGLLSSRWNDSYRGILRANIVLGRIGVVQMDETLRSRIVGEAKFLRAYFYFNLVKTFGDVPIVLQEIRSPEESYEFGREATSKVYTQIQQDLTEAAAVLPAKYSSTEAGRATSGAAKGMLARIYLFQGKFAEAAPLLKEIIDSKVFSLLPSYGNVFSSSNGNNAEILFAVQYMRGGIGEGSSLPNNFAPELSGDAVQIAGGNGYNQPTPDIEAAYEPGDLRKDVSMANFYINTQGKKIDYYYIRKYYDAGLTARNEGSTDYPILRYADVLLMYAECLNETGKSAEALPYLNQVRQRAGLKEKSALPQADLRLAIEQERRVELAFEGLRFFDLVRTNRLLPVMNAYFKKYNLNSQGVIHSVKEHQKLFPVPQDQLDVNPAKLTQNPGY